MRRMYVWRQFKASVNRSLEFAFRVIRGVGCFSGYAIITCSPSPQVCDATTLAAERKAFIRSVYCLFTIWAVEGEMFFHQAPTGTSIFAYG